MRQRILLLLTTVFFLILVACSSNFSETSNENTKSVKKDKEMVQERKTLRSTEFKVNEKYKLKPTELKYKTDLNGEFKAQYKYNNLTDHHDYINISVIIEGDELPLQEFPLEVEPNSSKDIDIKLNNLPNGSHIIYIITQNSKVKTNSSALEKRRDETYIAPYYFELHSQSSHVEENKVTKEQKVATITPLETTAYTKLKHEKIYLSDKNGNLVTDVTQNTFGDLFLHIANPSDFNVSGFLYFFSNGEYKEFSVNETIGSSFYYNLPAKSNQKFKFNTKVKKGDFFRLSTTLIPLDKSAMSGDYTPRSFIYSTTYIVN